MINFSMIKFSPISNFYIEIYCRDHFVDVKCFLNCNKVKKLGYTKVSQIVDALKNAQNL